MRSVAVLVALIVLAVGWYGGWHLRHGWGANADLKVHKARIPLFRRVRNRSWTICVVLAVFTLLILRVLV